MSAVVMKTCHRKKWVLKQNTDRNKIKVMYLQNVIP